MDRRTLAKRSLAGAAMLSALLVVGTTYVAHAVTSKQNVKGLYRDRVVSGVKVARNVFGSMNVFMPADGGSTRRPVVVWTHVGASLPNALEGDAYAHDFAERGYVSASVGRAQDVAPAIEWLHSNAGDYGIDPSRIFVAGFVAHAPADPPVLVLEAGGRQDRVTYEGHLDDVAYTGFDAVTQTASDFFASAIAAH